VRRTIRYGLYGAVLAALVAGPMAWANAADRTVNVVIDGHSQAVRTSASDVAGVLASAGLVAGPHDLLAPRAAAPVHDGSRIVLRRGRLLQLDVDGRRRAVWTTAATVSEALGQLGYPETDFVSVSRSKRLPLGPTAIALRSPIQLTVVHDGERETVTTTAATAGQLVADLGLEMLPSDKLSAAPDSPLRNGQTLRLTRVNRHSQGERRQDGRREDRSGDGGGRRHSAGHLCHRLRRRALRGDAAGPDRDDRGADH
jgi:uncharacterized protein YabE (DUF348 family)